MLYFFVNEKYNDQWEIPYLPVTVTIEGCKEIEVDSLLEWIG